MRYVKFFTQNNQTKGKKQSGDKQSGDGSRIRQGTVLCVSLGISESL